MANSIPASQLTQEQVNALQSLGEYNPNASYDSDYLATLAYAPAGITTLTETVPIPTAPSAEAEPTVYSAPTFGVPETPTMPEIPAPTIPTAPEIPAVEVTPVPKYEISPEQKAWEEMYSGQLQQWIEAGGYGIPEETQAKMIQKTTDTLKAKEAEDIRVMRNNMERRGLTNSGLVFANEQKIRANTTTAIANSITDIQVQSALMKMASFEKALGAAGEYLGYLSEQSQLAYQPKILTWQAQTQSDLIRYQEQINALLQEHNMQFQVAMESYDTAKQQAFLQYSTQAEANLTAYNADAQAKLMEYDAKNVAANIAYQAQVQMKLARYAAEMEMAKMQLAQIYTQQNMELAQAQEIARMQLAQKFTQQNMELAQAQELERMELINAQEKERMELAQIYTQQNMNLAQAQEIARMQLAQKFTQQNMALAQAQEIARMQLAYAQERETMRIAQEYAMQTMQQQAYWTDWINQQTFEREKELTQMQIEANERAAQQAGKGQLWGTMLGLGLGAIF